MPDFNAQQPSQAGSPPVAGLELQLPHGHPLYALWEDYRRQFGELPGPVLRLEGRKAMPEDEARKELTRLQLTVNLSAKKRLEQLRSAKPEDEAPPDLDAQVLVFLPKSGLSAWLLVYPPSGQGKHLDRAMLTDALEREAIRFGVDEALLDGLPQKADRYFRLIPAAWGTPPAHGIDGQVVELFPRTVDHKPTLDENNRADYTNLNLFHNVEEGEVICRILAPTEGRPGRTVQDQEIPAKNGRPAQVPKGRNTRLLEDGSALVAKIAGQVEFSGRSFQVKPLLEIAGNVDYSTGNINFVGDVHIHGDICSGFTVRAMGSIKVDGVVEACTVEAGGDLVMSSGVQGDNQAVIRAQRNIFAKYIENCCVCVKASLHAECIINCDVYCDGDVQVRAGRMTIIGGSIRASRQVSAGTIGSRTECHTRVILGGLPCGQFDQGVLSQEISEQEKELERIERQPDSPQKLRHMAKLRMNLLVNRQKLELVNKEAEQLAEDVDLGVCRMLCDTVYPGTRLVIGGQLYRFREKLHPCAARLTEGEIVLI